jgi:hypothetical protein
MESSMRSSLLLLLALSAHADSGVIDASVQTLIAGKSDPRDGKIYSVVPVYETVNLMATQLKLKYVDDFKLVLSGWGLLTPWGDAGPLPFGDRYSGDIDLAFAEGKLFNHHRIELRLGRQMVFGGAARAFQMDGANLTFHLWRGLSFSMWGGAPVIPRFMTGRGDATGGARLSWRINYDSEVGISFMHVSESGRTLRQEFGGDARWRPLRALTFSGVALMSTVEKRLADADLQMRYQPLSWIEVMADWRRTAPDLFLPRGSILTVFATETRDEAGTSIYLRPLGRLRLEGDYHFVNDDAGWGHRGGARVTMSLGRSWETLVGAEGRVLQLPVNGYWQARLFGNHIVGPVAMTLDLDCYKLQKPVNGETLSFTGSATVGYTFYPHWRFVVAGIADTTPFVSSRFEIIGKVTWDQSFRLRQVLK